MGDNKNRGMGTLTKEDLIYLQILKTDNTQSVMWKVFSKYLEMKGRTYFRVKECDRERSHYRTRSQPLSDCPLSKGEVRVAVTYAHEMGLISRVSHKRWNVMNQMKEGA